MIAKYRASAVRRARASTWRGVALALLLAGALQGVTATAGRDPPLVVFDRYSDLSSYGELARRLLSAPDADRFLRQLETAHGTPSNQPLDLAKEAFLVHVPPRQPERGYALLVFVPPWQQARMPGTWAATLDRRGVIFVTAARSGNGESALGRRAPLALLAAWNVMQRYPVSPQNVYVGGFSGGSRVALRLALGYPDVFHGALLNAGSDVLNNAATEPPIPLPPPEMLHQFQESSRLVYATGEHDEENLEGDRLSIASLAGLCMFSVRRFEIPRLDHSVADAAALARSLDALLASEPVDRDRLERCRQAMAH